MCADELLFLERFNPAKTYKGVKTFDCEEKVINDFLPQMKRQASRDNIFAEVLVNEREEIVGFLTATLYQLSRESIPASSFPYALPPTIAVIKIPMIGIDKRIQGKGWGTSLMESALDYSLRASENVAGIKGIYLDAKRDRVDFYRRFGFEELEDDGLSSLVPMLLNIDTLRKAVAKRRASA
ncbi:GNAT family N-acetyltransferase [Pantoea agglomerans]|uniref:GNAT family N-acetyltransferase n=1 Tax=Enterobacter agglomerans TaxID=549 RepID=UPI003209C6D8